MPSTDAAPRALVTIGRRARSKADKQQRIFEAASELFTAQGYSSATTRMVADRADVGTGTPLRYATSKAELLVMVMNEQIRLDTCAGVAAVSSGDWPTDAMLLAPQ